ncbi:hypothetical protein J7481_12465 [Labrenzia sp. R4_2]|uniref:hypothetical protein n=1 Tax=Labrenzia sp. R4_2 TaxID=2821107 RepID=UPI001ADD3C29|nr:hypothetical protein [Labrenzia sp. R4_2]MBO9420310.1 hypothetical protein [Labrenzia sp. R4_2]
MKKIARVIATVSVVLFPTTAAISAEAITGADLKELISGFVGTNKGFSITFASDGSVSMVDGSTTYIGVWTVSENTVCTEIKALRNGAPTCRTVTDEGSGKYKMTRIDNGKSLSLTKK